jgi:hypothetical protein
MPHSFSKVEYFDLTGYEGCGLTWFCSGQIADVSFPDSKHPLGHRKCGELFLSLRASGRYRKSARI